MEKSFVATATIIEPTKPAMSTLKVTTPRSTLGNLSKPSNERVHPPRTGDQIRIVQPSEYKEAAAALAEAFKDDHTMQYVVDVPDRPDWTEEQKWDLHVQILEYITYAHCLKGMVTTIGENYGCVALW